MAVSRIEPVQRITPKKPVKPKKTDEYKKFRGFRHEYMGRYVDILV